MTEYQTREFSVDWLEANSIDSGGSRVVLRETVDHKRWAIVDRIVFTGEDGEFYEAHYEIPATEMQEVEDPWGYADPVPCRRVTPYQITSVDFRPVKKKL